MQNPSYCISCGVSSQKTSLDRAHIKSRGAGGCDKEWNIMPLCRKCHSRQHTQGIISFIEDRPSVMYFLGKKGWIIENGKIFHPMQNIDD